MPPDAPAKLAKFAGPAVLLLVAAIAAWWLAPSRDGPASVRPGWQILRPPHDVNALVLYDGVLIAGGRDGLIAFDPASAKPAALPPDTPEMGYVKALLVDQAGQLWVGHRGGISRFDGTRWEKIATDASSAPGPVAALLERADGTLLAGGEAGLATLSASGLEPWPLPEGATTTVTALHQDRAGRLWVGLAAQGRGGLLLLDTPDEPPAAPRGWRSFGLEVGLVHLSVNAIFEDATGGLHLATGFSGRGGACRLEGTGLRTRWSCLTAADGLASDMVRLVAADSFGRLWIGSEFQGLAVLAEGHTEIYGPADGLAGTELKAFLETPDGALWLGCDKGLTRLSPEAARSLAPEPTE